MSRKKHIPKKSAVQQEENLNLTLFVQNTRRSEDYRKRLNSFLSWMMTEKENNESSVNYRLLHTFNRYDDDLPLEMREGEAQWRLFVHIQQEGNISDLVMTTGRAYVTFDGKGVHKRWDLGEQKKAIRIWITGKDPYGFFVVVDYKKGSIYTQRFFRLNENAEEYEDCEVPIFAHRFPRIG